MQKSFVAQLFINKITVFVQFLALIVFIESVFVPAALGRTSHPDKLGGSKHLFIKRFHGKQLLDEKVSLPFSSGSVMDLLREIEQKTSFTFVYTHKESQLTRHIETRVENESVYHVLKRVLDPLNITFTSYQKRIFLKQKPAAVSTSSKTEAPAILTGTIRDASTSEALPHATIQVKGTRFASVTDINGMFRITNLQTGTVVIVASYIGYQTLETSVSLQAGTTTSVDLVLQSATSQLQGITITGIRRGEVKALSSMQTAENVKYVLSQEQIERFPDATVGEAMQRVPGVAMDYSYGLPRNVIIRGLDQGMGTVTLNGNKMPSTQTNSRTVDLNGILSATVESIEVNKTLTPDMDADGTAGAVNIITKTPLKDVQILEGKVSGGYNQLMGKMNYEAAFSAGNRKGKWSYLLGANFNHSIRGEDRVQKSYDEYTIGEEPQIRLSSVELEGTELKRENLGAQLEIGFFPTTQSQYYLKGTYNKFYEIQTRGTRNYSIGEYSSPSSLTDVEISASGTPRDYHRDLLMFSLGTKKEYGNWSINADLTYSRGLYDQPIYYNGNFTRSDLTADLNLSNPEAPQFTFKESDIYDPAYYTTKSYTNRHQIAHDQDGQATVHVTRSFRIGSENKGIFKFGGRYKYKEDDHTRSYYQYKLKEGQLQLSDYLSGYNRSDFFDNHYSLSSSIPDGYKLERYYQQNKGLFEEDETYTRQNTDPDSYKGNESIAAGYVMSRINIKKFELIGGVRYERTGFEYKGNIASFDDKGTYLNTSKVSTSAAFAGFFPSLNVKYALNPNTNLRGAITRSLSRPGYYDLVPWQEVETRRKRINKGNPDLNQAFSTNADLLFEHYFKSVGLLSGGIFYKRISNYIYEGSYIQQGGQYDGWTINQTRNGADADVYGFEIAWQQQFTFLPGFLQGLGIYVNYSQIESRFTVPGVESTRSIRLPDMRPKVGNIALSYERFGFSGRISLNYYATFLKELSDVAANDELEQSRKQIDISASQKIGRHFTVFMGLSNLNNAQIKTRYRDGRPVDHKYYSMWGNIGVKFTPF